jgi:prepilin-type processing-associated H-X9-DG protein
LARYVPAEGLAILVEHNGFDTQPGAWKATAAARMLNETSLGTMLEDITAQVVDRGLQRLPGGAPVNGKEVVAVIAHLAHQGFAIGYCGTLNPPQPKAAVLVIRGAAKSEVFKQIVARIPPLNEPAAQRIKGAGGRTVFQAAGPPIRWWFEKDDAVFSFAPPDAPDPVVDTLDGKKPSALKNTARNALAKGEPGEVPVGLLFVDMAAMPPLPPDATRAGLDRLQRVEARWAIRGKGLVTAFGVQAPRPRRGILALFDQPPIAPGTSLAIPKGAPGYLLLSLDTLKLGDAMMARLKQDDPESAASVTKFSATFKQRTGLSLRDDLLGKLGPRMAVVSPSGGGSLGSIFGMWFHPPDMALVVELKNSQAFIGSLDRLIEAANRELKALGGMVSPQPGEPNRPGTEFAEFRRLKAPEQGYVLAVPPAALPTPSGLRPTIIVDTKRGLLTVATSPTSARRALPSLIFNTPATAARPAQARPAVSIPGQLRTTTTATAQVVTSAWPQDAVLVAQSDPSSMLPEILTNLPSLVQFVGFAASQNPPTGRFPNVPQPPPGRPFRLQVDPDSIPDAEVLRSYLFPSTATMTVDNDTIRFTTYQAFPIPAPSLNVGMETPVLIALLLPAVQSAREAARRAQCTNNLKQIGLAFHNFADANNGFPAAAITDKNGKPLLSWRVAILPMLDQQALFEKFKLDEPWDSPHNKELLQSMPPIFTCPSRSQGGEPGMTTYRAFAGKGALLEPNRPTPIAEITDGTSNTLMVVESTEAVPWTKPDDLPFDNGVEPPANPLFGAGSLHAGGVNALFADGAVRFIKMSISIQTFRALITKSGGEVVQADSF